MVEVKPLSEKTAREVHPLFICEADLSPLYSHFLPLRILTLSRSLAFRPDLLHYLPERESWVILTVTHNKLPREGPY